jgi:putative RNA 2'-phosphotransferase
MDRKRRIKLSKFLSLILRHKPEAVGLVLDDGGWAEVDQLIATCGRAGRPLTREALEQIVREGEKTRFALSEDGRRIRANYGHSIAVDLGLEPQIPPEHLFHGTATSNLGSITARGIGPGGRCFVHLSADELTAVSVGRRHGTPIVLRVRARQMHQIGFTFYHSESGIWLTEHVPREYIVFPAQ